MSAKGTVERIFQNVGGSRKRQAEDHHHQGAANYDDGPYQAGQRVGCAHGNYQVAQHVHQPCSACLRVCACRGGTLLPVLYVCVSSYGPESWYLGRSTSVTNSVLTAGIPERFLIIREAPGHGDPCGRKRVNLQRVLRGGEAEHSMSSRIEIQFSITRL